MERRLNMEATALGAGWKISRTITFKIDAHKKTYLMYLSKFRYLGNYYNQEGGYAENQITGYDQ